MCIHLSVKWPKGRFLASDKAENYPWRSKRKGKIARVRRKKWGGEVKKAIVAPSVFIFGYFGILGRKEKCLTEEVYLDRVTFKKTPARYTVEVYFCTQDWTRTNYCYFFMCKPGKVLSCSPGNQLVKITALFLVIFYSNENTLVTRGKSCIRRRSVRCKLHI